MTSDEARENYISEWFGHRVYPTVSSQPGALADQRAERCPFLSTALGESTRCVKSAASSGVCSISSRSNGRRQDWVVCPYRALDPDLTGPVVQLLFDPQREGVRVVPGPNLASTAVQVEVDAALRGGSRVAILLQDKIGGEISLSKTDKSPEFSFDITFAELRRSPTGIVVGDFGLMEVQTMDFHGSYRNAVKNLKDAFRLHGDGFAGAVALNPSWLCERIEGPNISNVFKRTFYQMMLKFQVGAHDSCLGCALAIPVSVWDSWQRHLAAPTLRSEPDGTYSLYSPGRERPSKVSAWIVVFDIATRNPTPDYVSVQKVIATDAESIAYFALKVAPDMALGSGSFERIPLSIRARLRSWWPRIV